MLLTVVGLPPNAKVFVRFGELPDQVGGHPLEVPWVLATLAPNTVQKDLSQRSRAPRLQYPMHRALQHGVGVHLIPDRRLAFQAGHSVNPAFLTCLQPHLHPAGVNAGAVGLVGHGAAPDAVDDVLPAGQPVDGDLGPARCTYPGGGGRGQDLRGEPQDPVTVLDGVPSQTSRYR